MGTVSLRRLALVVSFLGFCAIGAQSATTEKPKAGGTLRVGIRKDITNLNPFVEYLSTNALVRSLVYEGRRT
jgi:hypothetical protein